MYIIYLTLLASWFNIEYILKKNHLLWESKVRALAHFQINLRGHNSETIKGIITKFELYMCIVVQKKINI